MTDTDDDINKAINAFYMDELKGALTKAGVDFQDVDKRLGIAKGMTARWLRNDQLMRAPMFVRIAALTKEGPEVLFDRATDEVRAAGLLDHVEVLSDYALAASDPRPEEAGDDGEDLATEGND